jgi:hypothetical protein
MSAAPKMSRRKFATMLAKAGGAAALLPSPVWAIPPGVFGGIAASRRRVTASNWWDISGATNVAAYQPKGAASQSASYANLANPGTFDCAPGTAPSWNTSTGWTFNKSSSQYLTCGIVPATGWTIAARFANQTGSFSPAQWMCGVDDSGNNRFYLCPWWASAATYIYGSGGFRNLSGTLSSGTMGIAGQQGYLNGASDGSPTATWAGTQSNAMIIGGMTQIGGSPGYYFGGDIIAMAIYSSVLTSGNMSALHTAMMAL